MKKIGRARDLGQDHEGQERLHAGARGSSGGQARERPLEEGDLGQSTKLFSNTLCSTMFTKMIDLWEQCLKPMLTPGAGCRHGQHQGLLRSCTEGELGIPSTDNQ